MVPEGNTTNGLKAVKVYLDRVQNNFANKFVIWQSDAKNAMDLLAVFQAGIQLYTR
jgi:hypothetical protein